MTFTLASASCLLKLPNKGSNATEATHQSWPFDPCHPVPYQKCPVFPRFFLICSLLNTFPYPIPPLHQNQHFVVHHMSSLKQAHVPLFGSLRYFFVPLFPKTPGRPSTSVLRQSEGSSTQHYCPSQAKPSYRSTILYPIGRVSRRGILVPSQNCPMFPHVFLMCSPFNKFAYHVFVL